MATAIGSFRMSRSDTCVSVNGTNCALACIAAGWAAVGVTWAYVIVWWLLADVVKTLVQAVSQLFMPHNVSLPL